MKRSAPTFMRVTPVYVESVVADGAGAINGAAIDLTQTEQVAMVVHMASRNTTGTLIVKAQVAPDDGTGSPGTYADITGKTTASMDTDAETARIYIDSGEVGLGTGGRFLRFVYTVGTAGVIGNASVVEYGPRNTEDYAITASATEQDWV